MSVTLTIPDAIAEAIKLPEDHLQEELLHELAVALYAGGALSFGKARQLAGLGKLEFARLLTEHDTPRHYTNEELEDDLAYARRE